MILRGKIVSLDLDYLYHRPKITIQLNNQYVLLSDEFNNLQNEDLDIQLNKHREKRSLNANAYFHVLVNKIARVQNISDDEVKTKLNLQYGTIAKDEEGKIVGCKVPEQVDMSKYYKYAKWYKKEDNCNCYLFYKKTHNLNTEEFSKLLNGAVYEAKENGIQTLDDIEIERLMKEYEKINNK